MHWFKIKVWAFPSSKPAPIYSTFLSFFSCKHSWFSRPQWRLWWLSKCRVLESSHCGARIVWWSVLTFAPPPDLQLLRRKDVWSDRLLLQDYCFLTEQRSQQGNQIAVHYIGIPKLPRKGKRCFSAEKMGLTCCENSTLNSHIVKGPTREQTGFIWSQHDLVARSKTNQTTTSRWNNNIIYNLEWEKHNFLP